MNQHSNLVAVKAFAGVLATALAVLPCAALAADAAAHAADTAASPKTPPRAASAAPRRPAPHRAFQVPTKGKMYARAAWGVDAMKVRRVASGNLIRFDYRVTDPAQAAPLVDKSATPALYAPRVRATLSVPVMDKIGPLRQTGALKAGQEYWVTFSNKGNLVKPGDRVDVIIGRFHVDGLTVE